MDPFFSESEDSPVVTLPTSLFSCPVCLGIPLGTERFFQCRNGHLVCDQCFFRLPPFPLCPCCRVPIWEAIRNRAVETALNYLESDCPFKSRGCGARLPRKELWTHLRKCVFGPIHFCKTLGFSNCDFDAFGCATGELVDHLKEIHEVQAGDLTQNFFSLEFDYVGFNNNHNDPRAASDLNVIKLFGSDKCSSPNPSVQPTFLFLMKHDTTGLFLLCVCICLKRPQGQEQQVSEKFRTSFYFTSVNTQKCVASWPTLCYYDLLITKNNGDSSDDTRSPGDIWDSAFHISSHTLKAIQGQDEAIKILVQIRNVEEDL